MKDVRKELEQLEEIAKNNSWDVLTAEQKEKQRIDWMTSMINCLEPKHKQTQP